MTTTTTTRQQTNVLNRIIHDLTTTSITEKILTGYAGTGKTYLVGKLIEELSKRAYKVVVCAPTHKACKVLQTKMPAELGIEVKTAHHVFFEQPHDKLAATLNRYKNTTDSSTRQSAKRELEQMQGRSKMSFSAASSYKESCDLIICDEASMIGEDMARAARNLGISLLWVGDSGQLPPVGQKPGVNLIGGADYTLTEIVRTAKDSPVPLIANQIRQAPDVQTLQHIIEAAKSKYPYTFVANYIEDADINLCWTNATRGLINQAKWLHGPNNILIKGEQYIIHKGGQSLTIGDTITITSTPVKVQPYVYTITLCDERGVTHVVDISTTDLDSTASYKKNAIEVAEANYDELERKSRPVLALPHCITVHKSQGSEWASINLFTDNVLTNERMSFNDKKRWLYTGITRTSDKIYIN